ncbi:hypothetical protein M9H77_26737 [Catharanthus roseus]|uniref:Uncharacterized protein n=1 Tax=Catharanthus roseus TaxID=4058 RepID=A0ACC0ACP9_CATRO|nr:hypothetical protein M9H77_26737 [Catharanthus roseus]
MRLAFGVTYLKKQKRLHERFKSKKAKQLYIPSQGIVKKETKKSSIIEEFRRAIELLQVKEVVGVLVDVHAFLERLVVEKPFGKYWDFDNLVPMLPLIVCEVVEIVESKDVGVESRNSQHDDPLRLVMQELQSLRNEMRDIRRDVTNLANQQRDVSPYGSLNATTLRSNGPFNCSRTTEFHQPLHFDEELHPPPYGSRRGGQHGWAPATDRRCLLVICFQGTLTHRPSTSLGQPATTGLGNKGLLRGEILLQNPQEQRQIHWKIKLNPSSNELTTFILVLGTFNGENDETKQKMVENGVKTTKTKPTAPRKLTYRLRYADLPSAVGLGSIRREGTELYRQ